MSRPERSAGSQPGSSRKQRVSQHAIAEFADLRARFESLSRRRREVMQLAVTGLSNKEIAIRLGIGPRTVEIHRAWMMERMGAKNLAELVRIGMLMQLHA